MKLSDLHEMQDFRNHSGHREELSDLVKRISDLDYKLLHHNNNTEAMREWEGYSENLLPPDEPYWSELSEDELDEAIEMAEEIIDRYNI